MEGRVSLYDDFISKSAPGSRTTARHSVATRDDASSSPASVLMKPAMAKERRKSADSSSAIPIGIGHS